MRWSVVKALFVRERYACCGADTGAFRYSVGRVDVVYAKKAMWDDAPSAVAFLQCLVPRISAPCAWGSAGAYQEVLLRPKHFARW